MPLASGHHLLGFGIIGNDLGINYCFFRCVNPEQWVNIDEVDEPTQEIRCFQHLFVSFFVDVFLYLFSLPVWLLDAADTDG